MQYRLDKYGNQLSALGFGCMRFPQKLGRIEMEQTEQLLMAAIDGGVNYLDTAYIYPGSEAAVGEILEKNNARDRVYIATKLPHYLIKSREGLEKLFQEELNRLRTDHVDYYLMHMLTDTDTWNRLKNLGIEVYFVEDNIWTMDGDGELRLTIMATLAQEESRRTSERVKWGQQRRMEQGIVFGRDLLGYTVQNGVLSVNEEEAPIVRAIFHKYTNEGKGTHVIATDLRGGASLLIAGLILFTKPAFALAMLYIALIVLLLVITYKIFKKKMVNGQDLKVSIHFVL